MVNITDLNILKLQLYNSSHRPINKLPYFISSKIHFFPPHILVSEISMHTTGDGMSVSLTVLNHISGFQNKEASYNQWYFIHNEIQYITSKMKEGRIKKINQVV